MYLVLHSFLDCNGCLRNEFLFFSVSLMGDTSLNHPQRRAPSSLSLQQCQSQKKRPLFANEHEGAFTSSSHFIYFWFCGDGAGTAFRPQTSLSMVPVRRSCACVRTGQNPPALFGEGFLFFFFFNASRPSPPRC